MKALGVQDFPAFFKAVHGYAPFPWQQRLAQQVVETGSWPPLLDLPTASGKTAAIDVAVFHLACEAAGAAERNAPMRILFVIDRRIVVDEAFRRARKIADSLRGATGGVLRTVKQRLAELSGDPARPLDVVRLRGGVPQERDWARSPAQPLVAVSTVDQVGSRLLFRGYGVSTRMWPVHAGLVGADALWLLDEVHLSQPLRETLDAIANGHASEGMLSDRPRLAPFGVVHLSATPGEDRGDAFGMSSEDRKHDVLSRRLTAHKIARLVPVDEDEDLPDPFVEQALRLGGLIPEPALRGRKKRKTAQTPRAAEPFPPVHRLAVVLNRVNLARQVFERLRRKIDEDHPGRAEVVLLTGRIRPLDRHRLLEKLTPLLASPDRDDPEKPIFLVATQTIEAGADLDVDALVTEIAPIDALRQRFGRLDRLGIRGTSPAAILMPKKARQWSNPPWDVAERIYSNSARKTADWLKDLGDEIDFGIEPFSLYADEISGDLLAPREPAPVLLPPYVDLWATTSPAPEATPEPALFLHGLQISADVQVVWRADISADDIATAERWLDICPPSSLEAMSVPIWAVQKWLREDIEDIGFADVPERGTEADEDRKGRACLRREADHWVRADATDLRPGDTIVVPSIYGGCDEYGWNPDSPDDVADLGVEAHYGQRLRGALRVTEAALVNSLRGNEALPASEVWRTLRDLIPDEEAADPEALRASLVELEGIPETWARLLKGMQGRRARFAFINRDAPAEGIVLWAERRLPEGLLVPIREEEEARGEETVTDRDDSSAIGNEVELTRHLHSVEAQAHEFAERAGLLRELVRIVSLAGRMHDLGKADPRFQADLRGDSALAAQHPDLASLLMQTEGELLAKSGHTRLTRTLSAAPERFRHEALSVALARQHPEVGALPEDERDLLLWLVGTHHGHGRPFFPPSKDDAGETAAQVSLDGEALSAQARNAPLRLDQGWFELAERVRRTYGPWELARLEAMVRLADHVVSAEEQAEAGS